MIIIIIILYYGYINYYIEDMPVTLTALVKIYSTKYFCNTKVSGPGEIFVKQKFHIYGTLLLAYVHRIINWDGSANSTQTRVVARD